MRLLPAVLLSLLALAITVGIAGSVHAQQTQFQYQYQSQGQNQTGNTFGYQCAPLALPSVAPGCSLRCSIENGCPRCDTDCGGYNNTNRQCPSAPTAPSGCWYETVHSNTQYYGNSYTQSYCPSYRLVCNNSRYSSSSSACTYSPYYQPVCGTNGRTYGNADLANCDRVSIAYRGVCNQSYYSPYSSSSRRTCTCGNEYAPVCATNGSTYVNSCAANCADARISYQGVCGGTSYYSSYSSSSPYYDYSYTTCSSCAQINAPVCGNDGRTYGNACIANCLGATINYQAACKSTDINVQQCRSYGSCYNNGSCPSGTWCSNYPNYGCYVPECL